MSTSEPVNLVPGGEDIAPREIITVRPNSYSDTAKGAHIIAFAPSPGDTSCVSTSSHSFLAVLRAPSWLLSIAIIVGAALIGHLSTPHCRTFDPRDPSINYEFAVHETVPTYALFFISVLPIFCVFVPVIGMYPTLTPAVHEMNAWALTQALSCALALLMTETSKVYAGRLRPDFMSRLRHTGIFPPVPPPADTSVVAAQEYYANFTSMVCEAKYLVGDARLRDGHLSFPSGHSSIAFAAMVPLVFFLVSRLRPFYWQSPVRLLLSLSPLVLSFFVSISRTIDHRHHFSDILAGSLIGVVSGALAIHTYLSYSPRLGVWTVKMNFLLSQSLLSCHRMRGVVATDVDEVTVPDYIGCCCCASSRRTNLSSDMIDDGEVTNDHRELYQRGMNVRSVSRTSSEPFFSQKKK